MCCTAMSKVNNIEERVQYSYRKIDIGMPVYTDDIAAAAAAAGGIPKLKKEYGIVQRWKR